MSSLFPEGEEGKCELKASRVLDCVREALRWFDEAERLKEVMAEK